jgi:transposase-like protein
VVFTSYRADMLTELNIPELLESVAAMSERRTFLNRHSPICPKCKTEQIELKSRLIPASWRCRECHYKWNEEPNKRTEDEKR